MATKVADIYALISARLSSQFGSALSGLGASLSKVAGVAAVAGAALGGIGAAVGGFEILNAAFDRLLETDQQFSQQVQETRAALTTALDAFAEAVGPTFQAMAKLVEGLALSFANWFRELNLGPKVLSVFNDALLLAVQLGVKAFDVLRVGYDSLRLVWSVVAELASNLYGVLQPAILAIRDRVVEIATRVADAVQKVIAYIRAQVSDLLKWISGAFDGVADMLGLGDVVEQIRKVLTLSDDSRERFEALRQSLTTLFTDSGRGRAESVLAGLNEQAERFTVRLSDARRELQFVDAAQIFQQQVLRIAQRQNEGAEQTRMALAARAAAGVPIAAQDDRLMNRLLDIQSAQLEKLGLLVRKPTGPGL